MKKEFVKILSLVLVLAMCFALTACGSTQQAPATAAPATAAPATEAPAEGASDTTYHIGVLMKTLTAGYWQQMADGLQAEVDKMEGVDIEIFGAESEDDIDGQLTIMENMITSGKYDALCVAPITPTNLISGVVQANQAGIPVVDIDEKFDMDALQKAGGFVCGYATSDNIGVGETAAGLIMDKFPDGCGVCIIEGQAGATSGELRAKGCEDALAKGTGYTVLDVQPGDWDRAVALDVATNMINKYGDTLQVIFTANDTMTKGALQAMINTGRTDIFLVSTDADTELAEQIQTGTYDIVDVQQSPTGIAVSCVEQAIEAVKTGNAGSVDVIPQDTLIPCTVYDKTNIADFLAG